MGSNHKDLSLLKVSKLLPRMFLFDICYKAVSNVFVRRVILKNFFKQLGALQLLRQNSEVYEMFFRFENGFKLIPHAKKKAKGGEDYFKQSDRLIVLADGVGGWKYHNVDPRNYPRELCEAITQNYAVYKLSLKMKNKERKVGSSLSDLSFQENEFSSENIYSQSIVKKLLIKSANSAKSLGSSTCTILLLDKHTGKMYSSYIGDSLYMILRLNKDKKYFKYFKSKEQMHTEHFNTPYQVGKDGDDPENAITKTHQLNMDDMLISASDGLWDNLGDETIVEIINQNIDPVNVSELAEILATQAESISHNRKVFSPFAKKAKDFNLYYCGGKQDDITVIVSLILKDYKSHVNSSTSTTISDKVD